MFKRLFEYEHGFIIISLICIVLVAVIMTAIFVIVKKRYSEVEEPSVDKIKSGKFIEKDDVEISGEDLRANLVYDKSFKAKIIQAEDVIKERYLLLRKELLSYEKTFSKISWYSDTIRAGRPTIAKFTIRGKKLYLLFALNPNDYTNSNIVFEDVSSVTKYKITPLRISITSDRKISYALRLIEDLGEKFSIKKDEKEISSIDLTYKTDEELIKEELIIIKSENFDFN